MRKALVVGIVLALLAAGAAAVLLTRPKPVPTAPPVPMAGRPEVAQLRTATNCQVYLYQHKEFTLSPEEVAQLADIVEGSVVDSHPCGWKRDGELVGTCKSGGHVRVTFSELGEFWIGYDEHSEVVYGKSKILIHRFLRDCKAKRP